MRNNGIIEMKIMKNKKIADQVFEMILTSDNLVEHKEGQFVNIGVPGFFLRRPISVCDSNGNTLKIIYKTFGEGTKMLSTMEPRETINILQNLGNGFDVTKIEENDSRVALFAGGVGVPPMYKLSKKLLSEGKKVVAHLGFGSAKDVFYKNELEALGVEVKIATMDGSMGTKGTVIDATTEDFDYYFACGPERMLAALATAYPLNGQLSFEERMGCGYGSCMACSMKTADGGYIRLCKEGPVVEVEDVIING